MRIGLYGMPTAGKSYILGKLDFIEVVMGSKIFEILILSLISVMKWDERLLENNWLKR